MSQNSNVSSTGEGSFLFFSANSPSDVQIVPHSLNIRSYKSPTFCDFCGEMLFGLARQGLKCEGCGLNFHKRCADKIPNNCTNTRRRKSSSRIFPHGPSDNALHTAGSGAAISENTHLLSDSPSRDRKSLPVNTGRPVWVEKELAGRIRVPHTFVIHSYTRPTVCQHCKKLLRGLLRQGMQCKDCKFNVHKQCMDKIPMDCSGEVPKEWNLDASKSTETENGGGRDNLDDDSDESEFMEKGNGGYADHAVDDESKVPAK